MYLVLFCSMNAEIKCTYGLECKSFENGMCCYKSRFGLGWIPVGQCDNLGFNKISCQSTVSMCLQKVMPPIRELFILDESLDTNLNRKCNYCSTDYMLYSVKGEPEYRFFKREL